MIFTHPNLSSRCHGSWLGVSSGWGCLAGRAWRQKTQVILGWHFCSSWCYKAPFGSALPPSPCRSHNLCLREAKRKRSKRTQAREGNSSCSFLLFWQGMGCLFQGRATEELRWDGCLGEEPQGNTSLNTWVYCPIHK